MKIYHGSKQVIKTPMVKGSNPENDYGPSFYLTIDFEGAQSWACKNNIVGVVNEYFARNELYNSLKILDLRDKSKFSVLNWLAILMHFRTLSSNVKKNREVVLKWLEKYYIDVNEYDVVIGYRADDSYFRFPLSFINNELSFEDLESIYLSGNLGSQYAFMSQKAINALKFRKAIECDVSFVGHYYSKVLEANKNFNTLIDRPFDPKKTYVNDLIRKEYE